ncbi:MAG TPA: hypothetical protein ENN36_08665 [Candidatus Bathyarchaeota archaeon]|nr:hypothetical protein [Candidatus Bathyarchaeota archaeon]
MSKRISKQTSSLAFRLQKTYERILNAKPSLFIVGVAAVALALFLMGGGIYDMMVKDIAVAYFAPGGTLYVFYPSLNEQFLLESMLVMIFGAMGFAGFLIAYRSTKYAYNPRQAYRLLLVGCVLLLIGYILIERGLLTKFGLA